MLPSLNRTVYPGVEQRITGKYKQTEPISRQCDHTHGTIKFIVGKSSTIILDS